MFRLATFAAGPVIIGVLVTIISVLTLFVLVQMVKSNGKHTPISYMVGAIVAGLLLFTNVTFCGLVSSKNALADMEMSPEYRMAQRGPEMLSNVSPVLSEMASLLMESTIMSPEILEYRRQEINKYLWLLAIVSVVIYSIGGCMMAVTIGNSGRRYRSRPNMGRGENNYVRRERMHARGSHRR